MKIKKLDDFWRGWFIGDFAPSVKTTADFEIGILTHQQGEIWTKHYHKIATEYNFLIEGSMTIQGKEIKPNDLFILEPGEIADPVFHQDCKIVCVKTPSVIGDKYEVL